MLAQGMEFSDFLAFATGGLGQVLLWLAVGMHLIASKREGRFTVSPGMVALGLVGVSLVGVYAIVRLDWVIIAGQPVAILVGIRLLALTQPVETETTPDEQVKPRLPVVAPDSAEIKLSSIRDAGGRGTK
ncbi:hypothetical protein B7486_09445 [cyanobacterium TDX16]|nr:hypothetical protein B7486_09445 [cyanobacterium TDX16]